jgi:molecular chaperone Hsp33
MTIKTASRLVLGIAGDGPLSRVMAEIENTGDIRGMVSSPQIEIPRANLDDLGVGKAIGSGLLRVWKEEPDFSYESQVAIADGRIGDAVAHFLERSEQTRSAVLLGVLAERKGITAAGGVMLEALPGSADEELAGFESHLETLPSVSKLMADEGLDGLIHRVLAPAGYREIETRTIRYRCRCSGSGIRRFLSNLAEEERGRLKTEAGAYEAECVFCGHRYSFEDLDQTTAPGPETVG